METYNKAELYKKNPTIYLEANPNPNSLKFVLNYMLMPEGVSHDFPDAESARNAPLAQELFKFDYVKRVFYMSNFITITKSEDREWIEIKDALKDFIKAYLEDEKPLLLENPKEEVVPQGQESEIAQKINNVLEEYVRPAVEQDGGAISFHSFHDGVVKVLLQGACSGCPSSTITLKAGIENLLKRMVPEVRVVEAEGI